MVGVENVPGRGPVDSEPQGESPSKLSTVRDGLRKLKEEGRIEYIGESGGTTFDAESQVVRSSATFFIALMPSNSLISRENQHRLVDATLRIGSEVGFVGASSISDGIITYAAGNAEEDIATKTAKVSFDLIADDIQPLVKESIASVTDEIKTTFKRRISVRVYETYEEAELEYVDFEGSISQDDYERLRNELDKSKNPKRGIRSLTPRQLFKRKK